MKALTGLCAKDPCFTISGPPGRQVLNFTPPDVALIRKDVIALTSVDGFEEDLGTLSALLPLITKLEELARLKKDTAELDGVINSISSVSLETTAESKESVALEPKADVDASS